MNRIIIFAAVTGLITGLTMGIGSAKQANEFNPNAVREAQIEALEAQL